MVINYNTHIKIYKKYNKHNFISVERKWKCIGPSAK
jgi:hypothetical protein